MNNSQLYVPWFLGTVVEIGSYLLPYDLHHNICPFFLRKESSPVSFIYYFDEYYRKGVLGNQDT